MRHNTHDKTLYRNYVRKWKFLIQEYELVKQKRHPKFRFVADFYRFHQTHRQTFFKYYHRFRQSGAEHALVPQPRGPKWKSRRVYGYIEQQVLQHRRLGVNRYEICQLLAPKLQHLTPSPSTVYRITQRHGLNRLTPKLKQEKRRIVKQKAGELGHLDCHHLSKDLIATDPTRYYLVCVLDACTRLAWAEVVTDLKSLTVMFSALKSFNLLHQRYQLQFAEVLTDKAGRGREGLEIPMGDGLALVVQFIQQRGAGGDVQFEHFFAGEPVEVHDEGAQAVPVCHHQQRFAFRQSRPHPLPVIGQHAFGRVL